MCMYYLTSSCSIIILILFFVFFFFFSSRRRHTRSLCDWSSDVCSSDLEKARPVPTATANSVGALVPEPNGIWPPRTPNRVGAREPTSAPADQLHVSNAPAPASDQERHATAAASRTLGLGANRRPPPAIRGRSVSAVVASPTLARSRLSLRAHAARLNPGASPSSALADTPSPS